MSGSVGLLAGLGRLPVEIAMGFRRRGRKVVAVSLHRPPEERDQLREAADVLLDIPFWEWSRLLAAMSGEGLKDVFVAGKVPKSLLFEGRVELDDRLRRVFASAPAWNDDALLQAVVGDLAREGFRVGQQTEAIPDLLIKEGEINRPLTEAEWADVRFGIKMARGVAALDIGQAVVIRNRAVIGVEAIDGTDALIQRCGRLAGEGTVVVKVAKPQQDLRFDVPAIGLGTMRQIQEVGGTVLALDAGKGILLEREELMQLADEAGIGIVGVGERDDRGPRERDE